MSESHTTGYEADADVRREGKKNVNTAFYQLAGKVAGLEGSVVKRY